MCTGWPATVQKFATNVTSQLQSTFNAERAIAAEGRAQEGILLIAYHFPPSAAVGGRRVANFGSALRSMGWRVRALTIPDRSIEQLDPARLTTVEGIPIDVA